ncbi:MAG: hypothetical protein NVSMB33_05660 [Ktedonobacteraceae bacterium]
MLVTMKREMFDALDYAALEEACIGPTLLQVHEINPVVKARVLAQLTNGQRALFLFRVLHDIAGKSADEFYHWISYLLTEEKRWTGIKRGLRFFGDDAMLRLLDETEGFLEARKQRQKDAEGRDIPVWNIHDDPELLAVVSQLYATFCEIVPATHKLIGAYIRNNASEFVQFRKTC